MIPGSYTVNAGDTFNTISSDEYCDGGYAPNIAQANGMVVSSTPPAGYVLRLPQVIPMYNNFSTSVAIDQFMTIMMGNLYPALQGKLPPPMMARMISKHKKHGGFFGGSIFGEIVDCIVVAAACFLGPEAGTAAGVALFGSIAAGVSAAGMAAATLSALAVEAITSAVVAGITDAVGQELAVALGAQEHFSLRQATDIGLTAGIIAGSAGFGGTGIGLNGLGANLTADAKTIGDALYLAGRTAVLEQLAGMATGTQSFSLRGIADSMAANIGVNTLLQDPAIKNSALGNSLSAQSTVGSVISSTISEIGTRHGFSIENILAGAIGSGLGVAIGEEIGTPFANYINKQKTAYDNASSSSQQTNPNQQSQAQLMQRQGLFGGNYNSAQTGSVAGDGYGQGNTVGTSLSDNPSTADNGISISNQLSNALVWNPITGSSYGSNTIQASSALNIIEQELFGAAVGVGNAIVGVALGSAQTVLGAVSPEALAYINSISPPPSLNQVIGGVENLFGMARSSNPIMQGYALGQIGLFAAPMLFGEGAALLGAGRNFFLSNINLFEDETITAGITGGVINTTSPQSIAAGASLNAQLSYLQAASYLQQIGVVNADGELSISALGNTMRIMPGYDLTNPDVIKELSELDDINNWGKYSSTNPLVDSAGNNLQVHYYYNNVTGQVYYPLDFKVVMNTVADVRMQSEFDITPNLPSNYYRLGN